MLIKRDPFARQELHRSNVYSSATCKWCGNSRTTKPKSGAMGKSYLYQYRIETDGGHVYYNSSLFCSLSCRNAYCD